MNQHRAPAAPVRPLARPTSFPPLGGLPARKDFRP